MKSLNNNSPGRRSGNSSGIATAKTTDSADDDIESQTKKATFTQAASDNNSDDNQNNKQQLNRDNKWLCCVRTFAAFFNIGIFGFSIALLVGIMSEHKENMASTSSEYRQDQYKSEYAQGLGMTIPLTVMSSIGLIGTVATLFTKRRGVYRCLLWTSIALYIVGVVMYFAVGGMSKSMASFGLGLLLIVPAALQGKLLEMMNDDMEDSIVDTEKDEPSSSSSSIQKDRGSTTHATSAVKKQSRGKPLVPNDKSATLIGKQPKTSKRRGGVKNECISKSHQQPTSKEKGPLAPTSPKKKRGSSVKKRTPTRKSTTQKDAPPSQSSQASPTKKKKKKSSKVGVPSKTNKPDKGKKGDAQ